MRLATVEGGHVSSTGDLHLSSGFGFNIFLDGLTMIEWLTGKADTGHSHMIADVTGLQTALDDKAVASHSHVIADTIGLQAELDDKADSVHVHAVSDVTGLQSALDAKADTGHGHAISDTTGLQSALDAKADASHSHVIADVTGLQTQLADIQARLTALESGTPVFTKSWESSQIPAPGANNMQSISHNLGEQPRLVVMVLINIIAERGYTPGDQIVCGGPMTQVSSHNGSHSWGYVVVSDSNNVYLVSATQPLVMLETSPSPGAYRTMTAANWNVIIRAYA